MNRRTFLQAGFGTALLGVTGCLSGGDSSQASAMQSLGTAVVDDQLKVGVTGYTFIDQYATYERDRPRDAQSFTPVTYKEPPTSGGQFLLVFVFAEHKGSARQYFPSGENDTTLSYDDEPVNQFYPQYVFTDGQRDYGSYYGAVTHAEANSRGAYPPYSAQGYMLFGVPKQFDPAKVTLEITWGWENIPEQSKGPTTATWELLPNAKNNTAGEPPTSATHQDGVTTRTQTYNTSTEESTTTGWDTIDGTKTYNNNDDDLR